MLWTSTTTLHSLILQTMDWFLNNLMKSEVIRSTVNRCRLSGRLMKDMTNLIDISRQLERTIASKSQWKTEMEAKSLPVVEEVMPTVEIPISRSMPKPEELAANDELRQFLLSLGNMFDTEEGAQRRQIVLDKLQEILEHWAEDVGKTKDIPSDQRERGGGIRILLFGSTKLQVNNADSDIDTLCVAPSFITREDFFDSFCKHLSGQHDVEAVLAIPDAYTPVIKFIYNEHSVDMVFASLHYSPLPADIHLLDFSTLQGLDEASVRSLNGVRVAECICNIVPNMHAYRLALRVIKHWARARGLYSSVLGFLGGVNFAILVAQISRLYVNACPFTLVQKFFAIYTFWKWPVPVMLREYDLLVYHPTDDKDKDLSHNRYLGVWNSLTTPRDAEHLMPVITPAYPAMNSAYNVAAPQFRAIHKEIVRGHVFFQEYAQRLAVYMSTNNGSMPPSSSSSSSSSEKLPSFPWDKLCQSCKTEFFQTYPRFIQVDICAEDAHEHRLWFGWVESRLRTLFSDLDTSSVVVSHPIANCFHRRPREMEREAALIHLPSTVSAPAALPSTSSSALPSHSEPVLSSERTATPPKKERGGSLDSEREKGADTGFATPPRPKDSSGVERKAADLHRQPSDPTAAFVSSFFVGLSVRVSAGSTVDLSRVLMSFSEKVMRWKDRRREMTLRLSVRDYQTLPDWVFLETPEPSSIQSCTPSLIRQRSLSLSVTRQSTLSERGERSSDGRGAEAEGGDRLVVTEATSTPLRGERESTSSSHNSNSHGGGEREREKEKESFEVLCHYESETETDRDSAVHMREREKTNDREREAFPPLSLSSLSLDSSLPSTSTSTSASASSSVSSAPPRQTKWNGDFLRKK